MDSLWISQYSFLLAVLSGPLCYLDVMCNHFLILSLILYSNHVREKIKLASFGMFLTNSEHGKLQSTIPRLVVLIELWLLGKKHTGLYMKSYHVQYVFIFQTASH